MDAALQAYEQGKKNLDPPYTSMRADNRYIGAGAY